MALGLLQTGWVGLMVSLILQDCRVSVLSSDWAVLVPSAPMCAGAGSSVVLPCSYNFPMPYRVLSEMWCRDQSRCITPRYVYHSHGILPELAYQGRVEYLGKEGTRNCSLRISDLKQSDNGKYMFYFITNHPVEKPPEQTGVTLLVADNSSEVAVSVSPSGEAVSGSTLLLSCCCTTQPQVQSYTWYRTGCSRPAHLGQILTIINISATESGNYYCEAQTTNGSYNSSAMHINVQYAPRNTSVSVYPLREVVPGSSVTLSCTSDANPPVESYTWFHRAEAQASLTGTGRSYSIASVRPEDSGQYCCVVVNKHGSHSCDVTISVVNVNAKSFSRWRRWLTVAIPVALILIIIITVARLRMKGASSHQAMSLPETNISLPLS